MIAEPSDATATWRWLLPLFARRYFMFSALAVLMFGGFFLIRFWNSPDSLARLMHPEGRWEFSFMALVPFFGPYGWMSAGYAVLFAQPQEQVLKGAFWRFNVLNGSVFWVALWGLSMVLAASLGAPEGRVVEPVELMLSISVSLPALIGMSALAAASSFWLIWLQRLFQHDSV
jgi:hypothetical protein